MKKHLPNLGTAEYPTLEAFRHAPSGIGPLANTWKDKPHRLVYDLVKMLKDTRMKGNVVTIPVSEVELFARVVREFQEQGLAFGVETTAKDFIITITGY